MVAALAVAIGCSRGDAPPQPPDITGEITLVTAVAGGLSLRVEELSSETSGNAKAIVRTDGTTRWSGLPSRTGEVRSGAPPEVGVGMQVQVYFDGPAAMSYPLQGKAALIIVLRRR